MQNVKRVTLTGDWQAVTFNGKSRDYFVKNYSEGDIFVSFEENDNENTCFKIKTGMGETVAKTFVGYDKSAFYTDTIYVKGTGEVEIQALDI